MNIKELETKLNELQLPKTLTAYGASIIASEFFGKHIRPQMIVNYLSKSYLTGVKRDGKWNVDHESFMNFLERYAMRNLVTVRKGK